MHWHVSVLVALTVVYDDIWSATISEGNFREFNYAWSVATLFLAS